MKKSIFMSLIFLFITVFHASAQDVQFSRPLIFKPVEMDGSDKITTDLAGLDIFFQTRGYNGIWKLNLNLRSTIKGQNTKAELDETYLHYKPAFRNPRIEHISGHSAERIRINYNQSDFTGGAELCRVKDIYKDRGGAQGQYRFVTDMGALELTVPADLPADVYTISLIEEFIETP